MPDFLLNGLGEGLFTGSLRVELSFWMILEPQTQYSRGFGILRAELWAVS